MKAWMVLTILLGLFSGSSAMAGGVVLPKTLMVNGRTFNGVIYESHDAAFLKFTDEYGEERLPIAELPKALQDKLGYDPVKGEAAREADAKKQAEAIAARDWEVAHPEDARTTAAKQHATEAAKQKQYDEASAAYVVPKPAATPLPAVVLKVVPDLNADDTMRLGGTMDRVNYSALPK